MLFGGGILGFVFLAFWVWALYDVITTPDGAARHLPKVAWVFVVLLFAVLGALVWVALGRPRGAPLPGVGDRPPKPARRMKSDRWHPALDERAGTKETERERIERERQEYYRRMDEELDRRLAAREGGQPAEDERGPQA